MKILTVTFQEPFSVSFQGEIISMVAFKTTEHGNIKFGIEAPRHIKVHREEIYQAIQQKTALLETDS